MGRQTFGLLDAIFVFGQFATSHANRTVIFQPEHNIGRALCIPHNERVGSVSFATGVRNKKCHCLIPLVWLLDNVTKHV